MKHVSLCTFYILSIYNLLVLGQLVTNTEIIKDRQMVDGTWSVFFIENGQFLNVTIDLSQNTFGHVRTYVIFETVAWSLDKRYWQFGDWKPIIY